MNKFCAFAFIVFALCSIGFSQNTMLPAYAILEEYTIPLDNKVCEPLVYIDSVTGKGNLIATIVEAVINKQIVAYSPEEESGYPALSWAEVQDLLGYIFDTTNVEDYQLNGKFITGDLVIEKQCDWSSITHMRLKFIVIFDANHQEVARYLVELLPLQSNQSKYKEVQWLNHTFLLHTADKTTKTWLNSHKSLMPGNEHKTYLELLTNLRLQEFLRQTRCISFVNVNSMLDTIVLLNNRTDISFEYPTKIDKNESRLIIKKVDWPELNSKDEGLSYNLFRFGSGSPDTLSKYAESELYIPLIYPLYSAFGYISVREMIFDAVDKGSLDAYCFSNEKFFVNKLDTNKQKSVFYKDAIYHYLDPIEYFDTAQNVILREIEGYYILEILLNNISYPMAICPLEVNYSARGEILPELKPMAWIPFNTKFRILLQQQEAYWPGKLPVMSLWDYFCANYYGGEIISEQKITQAEWTKMLEVLK